MATIEGVGYATEILKHNIFEMDIPKNEKNFFKLCFSLTQRKSSFQKRSIYKMYRVKEEKRDAKLRANKEEVINSLKQELRRMNVEVI